MESKSRERDSKITILPLTSENIEIKDEINIILSRIDKSSLVFENSLIAKAWIETNFGEYERSNNLIDSLLVVNPESELFYEANTLKGYNDDALGLKNSINESYEIILNSHRKFFESQKNRDERVAVIDLVAKNYATTSKILLADDSDNNYREYLEIKNRLMVLVKNSREYLVNLSDYNPSLARLAEIDYQKKIINQIIEKGESEIDKIETLISKSINISNQFAKIGNIRDYINTMLLRSESTKLIKRVEKDQIRVNNKLNRIEREDISINYWSDLSFVKYVLNSLDFNNLDDIESRIEKKEEQLLQLEESLRDE
jgi:hypothetical protein